MTTLRITRPHQLPHEAARKVAEDVATDLQTEYGLQYEWADDVLRFHTFGVRGDLHVGALEIILEAQLGPWLLPFRDNLEREINRHFDHHLQENSQGSSAQRVA